MDINKGKHELKASGCNFLFKVYGNINKRKGYP